MFKGLLEEGNLLASTPRSLLLLKKCYVKAKKEFYLNLLFIEADDQQHICRPPNKEFDIEFEINILKNQNEIPITKTKIYLVIKNFRDVL